MRREESYLDRTGDFDYKIKKAICAIRSILKRALNGAVIGRIEKISSILSCRPKSQRSILKCMQSSPKAKNSGVFGRFVPNTPEFIVPYVFFPLFAVQGQDSSAQHSITPAMPTFPRRKAGRKYCLRPHDSARS